MELTRTDAVYSRIAMVLFLCRNKSSRNELKINGELFLEYIKNTGRKIHVRGASTCPRGWGARPLPRGPPVGSPMPIFWYMKSFVRRKIIRKLSGRDSAATRRNLGGTNLGLRQSCSAGDTSLREGEIIAIVITNAPLIGRGQSPSTSSPAPSPLKP